jgi:hypothetical protein
MENFALPSPGGKWVSLGVALFVLFALYRWTALPDLDTNYESTYYACPGLPERYNLLAEALLAGKTSLLVKPHPELLALDDPYDPCENHRRDASGSYYGLHDVSLFQGKYFLYFGVTPAVTLFAPFRLVTGHYLPNAVGALIFALGGLLWSALLLNLLIDRFLPALEVGSRFLLILALGCCNCVLYLLRSPFVYEIAILSAYFFLMGGLFFLARGCLGTSWRPGSVAIGSLFLGLAIGCRPHMALVALVVFAVASVWVWAQVRSKTMALGEIPGVAAAFVGPWLLCIGILGAYNYHRFHSFTEFGARYALIGGTVRLVNQPLLDSNRLLADLFCYLFFPPELHSRFPYIHLRVPAPSLAPAGHFGFTPIGGLLLGMPFLGLLALAPLTLFRAWNDGRYAFLATFTVLFGGGVLELVCVSCFGGAMRYTVDFANLLVFAALLTAFDLDLCCQRSVILKRAVRAALAAGLTAGCLFNLGISIEGQRDLPRDRAVCGQLRGVFPRLPFLANPLTARLQVVFPANQQAGRCEPLVVTGRSGAGDFVYVRYRGDHTVTFLFDHWGVAAQQGKTVSVAPGRRYLFDVELRTDESEVVCRLDGEDVLVVDSDLYPPEPSTFRVGENPIGGGLFTSEVFSGKIQAETVHFPLHGNSAKQ